MKKPATSERDVYGDRRARVECLRFAVECRVSGETPEAIMLRAEKYFDFVHGKKAEGKKD